MDKTLTYADTINRIGFTVINDVKVVQYTCNIPTDNPGNMRVHDVILDRELYKANLDTCLADMVEFTKAAYELQAKYM